MMKKVKAEKKVDAARVAGNSPAKSGHSSAIQL
jgi:hypothetical protein